jgi:hypothetical protein
MVYNLKRYEKFGNWSACPKHFLIIPLFKISSEGKSAYVGSNKIIFKKFNSGGIKFLHSAQCFAGPGGTYLVSQRLLFI